MAYRIFISLIVLVCAYLAFETIRFKFMQHSLLGMDAEYSLGNPDGDLTFVKFFEYSCSQCRAGFPVIQQALKKDGQVKFIPRPLQPIDSQGINPSLLVYAAAKQGGFEAMHDALIKNYRVIDEQVIQDLSLEIGIDHEKLKVDIEDKDVLKRVQKNLDLFTDYQLRGTPAYAIGKNILFIPDGDLSTEDFLTLFSEARGQ